MLSPGILCHFNHAALSPGGICLTQTERLSTSPRRFRAEGYDRSAFDLMAGDAREGIVDVRSGNPGGPLLGSR